MYTILEINKNICFIIYTINMLKNRKNFDIFIKNIIMICIFVFFCFLFIIYFFNLKENLKENFNNTSGLNYSSYSNNNGSNSFQYRGTDNYQNCLNFFNNAGTPAYTGTVTSLNSIHTTSNFGLTNNSSCAISFYGYLLASRSGTWSFTFGAGNLANDDLSVFWIGTAGESLSSLKSRVTESNYNFGVTFTVPFNNCSWTKSLIAGNYYPILLNWGQSGGGSVIGFGITPPNGSMTYDGRGYFFTSNNIDKKFINFANCRMNKYYNGTVNLNEINNDTFTIDEITTGFLGGQVNNTICNDYSTNNNEYIYNCKNDGDQDNCAGFFNYYSNSNNINTSKITVNNSIINNNYNDRKKVIDLNINNIQNNRWTNNINSRYYFTYYKDNAESTPTIETKNNVKSVKLSGNDHFRMNNGSNELIRSITYIIWIYSNSTNNSTIIYENGQIGFGDWCYPVIKITNNQLDSGIFPYGVPNNNYTLSKIDHDFWYQIALVYDDNNHSCIVYLNGNEVSSNYDIKRYRPWRNEIYLMLGSNGNNPSGCWNTGNSNNFVGNINSFTAYNFPFTRDEVQQNYNNDVLSLGL